MLLVHLYDRWLLPRFNANRKTWQRHTVYWMIKEVDLTLKINHPTDAMNAMATENHAQQPIHSVRNKMKWFLLMNILYIVTIYEMYTKLLSAFDGLFVKCLHQRHGFIALSHNINTIPETKVFAKLQPQHIHNTNINRNQWSKHTVKRILNCRNLARFSGHWVLKRQNEIHTLSGLVITSTKWMWCLIISWIC